MTGIGAVKRKFMLHIMLLYVSLRGRHNYLNCVRYNDDYSEQSLRFNFAKGFDFATFNSLLVATYASKSLCWVFDPSYIAKSGKHTPGVGYFWSGCQGKVKWGLELCGLALSDRENHTAFHHHAVLTPNLKSGDEEIKLLAFYASIFIKDAETIARYHKKSKYVAVDAFFSKLNFVAPLCAAGYHVTSRMRTDAYLRYRYQGPPPPTGTRGRKKEYGGKIDIRNVSEDHFTKIAETTDEKDGKTERIFEGEAHIRSLERWCKVVIVQYLDATGKITRAYIYFCTDRNRPGIDVLEEYRLRFQIEFLYRDSKQFLGLTHSQSRNEDALDFHLNLSLTMINVAKVDHWLHYPKDSRPPFSMADVKTLYFNELILNKLILIYGKDPNVEKNNPLIAQLYKIGTIAA